MMRCAGAFLAAAMLVGCGAAATTVAPTGAPTVVAPTILEASPNGFVTHYRLSFEPPFEDEPYTEGGFTDAFLLRERVTLYGPDGKAGSGVLTAIDYRPRPDRVECGGETYVGELAHDIPDPPGGFEGELTDGTTMSLIPDRQVVVYVGNTFPNCFEHYGTYTITSSLDGPNRVRTGRYAWINATLDFE